MGCFGLLKDIFALIAFEWLSKILLGSGLAMIFFGAIFAYPIVDALMRWMAYDASTTKAVSVITAIVIFLGGCVVTGGTIVFLLWARKRGAFH
jgi:hypothetical protein